MFISKTTIDKVFQTAVIEEVIGDFIVLKKAGANYKALSPFTDEKTPSFVVSPSKSIWKDFSSGKGGNLVSFLMEHEHYTYPEAIVYLAKKYNIPIETTQQTEKQKQQNEERESLYSILDFAQKFYQKTLWEHSEGKAVGFSYFKERGFTDETIQDFGLGYNADTWTYFTDYALSKGFRLEFLQKAGLTILKEDNKKFDRFKGRVLFPIHSIGGRVLGFGGRSLKRDKNIAKYLNSPESYVYHKSQILYGIYQAKNTIVKENLCYLVEGYTDVISMHQKGIKNVVASSGTSLAEKQIQIIQRFTKNITLLFDGDFAGIQATIRGIDLILAQGMNARIVMFPEGQDPDSFAKKVNQEDLKTYIKQNAKDFIKFKTQMFLEQINEDPIKKGTLIRDIVSTIAKIPNVIQREIYIQTCAKILKISEQVLFRELEQTQQTNANQLQKNIILKNQKSIPEKINHEINPLENKTLEVCEREILKILLLYPNEKFTFEDKKLKKEEEKEIVIKKEYTTTPLQEIYLQLQTDEIEFNNEIFKIIYGIIKKDYEYQKKIDKNYIKNLSKNENITKTISDILMEDEKYPLSKKWEQKGVYSPTIHQILSRSINDILIKMRSILVEQKIKALKKQENKQEIMNYNQLRIIFYKWLNRVV